MFFRHADYNVNRFIRTVKEREHMVQFGEFTELTAEDKLAYLDGDSLFHFIMARQLNRESLEKLSSAANRIRGKAQTDEGARELKNLLPHKRAMMYFNQPSSRTFFSFMNACYVLGMSVSETRDAKMTSEKKGESFEDTICTFASYTDILIMRNSADEAAERAALTLDNFHNRIPVLNAGSGKTEHPTQALLDVYTIMREFYELGGIDGKKILMAGDLKRGRTVRSLCYLLAEFNDVEIYFAAVPEFQMEKDVRNFLDRRNLTYRDVDSMKDAVPEVDVVYMTRIQDEHDKGGESAQIDHTAFNFKPEYLDTMKETARIMHPLPRREEIPSEVDQDPRAAYWRQEENGMWARAALIAEIFNAEI